MREHQDTVLVSIFDDYTVFRIQKEEEERYAGHYNLGHEKEPNTDSSINFIHDQEPETHPFTN